MCVVQAETTLVVNTRVSPEKLHQQVGWVANRRSTCGPADGLAEAEEGKYVSIVLFLAFLYQYMSGRCGPTQSDSIGSSMVPD